MAFTSYSDLKTEIANYLGRDDLTSQIPTFIRLAEDRLRRELRLRQMLKHSTATTTSGDSTVGLPTDFLGMKEMYLNTTPVSTMTFLTPSSFFTNARTTDSGKPVHYTMIGAEFQFAPVPDSAYSLRMIYYYKPDYLSDTNTTNLFLANCPDLLLYGSLAEAEPYLMNDERINTWATLYQRGLDALRTSDDDSEYPSSPLTITLSSKG
jgi:hypothetical protein